MKFRFSSHKSGLSLELPASLLKLLALLLFTKVDVTSKSLADKKLLRYQTFSDIYHMSMLEFGVQLHLSTIMFHNHGFITNNRNRNDRKALVRQLGGQITNVAVHQQ